MFRHRGHHQPWRRALPLRLLAVFGAVTLVLQQPVASVAAPSHGRDGGWASTPDSRGSVADPAPVPSQAYLDAKAHENDVIAFAPGARASVAYRPRSTDAWTVDGKRPVALPAGRFSGAEILSGVTAPNPESLRDYDGQRANRPDPETALPVAPAAVDTVPATATNSLRRQVVGFLPYWMVSSRATVLDYDALSTVAYFGVGADAAGNLIKSGTGWSGWTSSSMTNVLNNAHASGTRVVLTIEVFAWSSSEATTQTAILSSSTARNNLAHQLAAAVRDRGADGVNVDFEPIATGQGANFTAFVRALRGELNAIQSGYEITIDVTGYVGNYEAANLVAPGAADAIFLMGYDFRGSGADPVGSISPLVSSRVYDLTDSVSRFLALIPPSKLLLGLPWYGRAWSTADYNGLNAPNMSGSTYGYSVTATYATAKELADANGHLYDSAENSAWTYYRGTYGTRASFRELYYDDARSLAAKYDFVNQLQLRGSGIWCLGNDGYVDDAGSVVRYPDLWQPILDKFVSDTTPPESGIVRLAPTQSEEAFAVSWTGRDDLSAIYAYDVDVSVDGGTWTRWLTGTVSTSATYVGDSGHGYAFRVRASDTVGNLAAWDVTSTYVASPTLAKGGFGLVQADLLNVRKGPGVAYEVDSQMTAGDLVAIVDGPQTADGYTWYQVMGPLHEWCPVGEAVETGWVATAGTSQWVVAAHAPNSTFVSSLVTDFRVSGTTSTAAGPRTGLTVAGAAPSALTISWSLISAADAVTLMVYRYDGSLAGTVAIGAQGAGAHTYRWDGTLAGKPVKAGNYMIQVRASAGATAYVAPASNPFPDAVWASYGLQLTSTGRWYGGDRFATGAAISQHVNDPGVPVVFVATGMDFPDALAAAPVAARRGGPVLLVTASSVPSSTAAELTRLKPASIVVVGSSAVVSDTVLNTLKTYTSGTVSRWYGADRYATAASVSSQTFGAGVPVAFIATGTDFPDALSGGAAAARLGGPVLLTQPTALPAVTTTELARLKPAKIVILGSTGAVSAGVETTLRGYSASVERWGGSTRTATSAAVSARTFSPGVPIVFLATSMNYPDAISGAAAAGKLGGPILLVDPGAGITPEVATELTRLQPARIVVVGSSSVVSDTVLGQAGAYPVGY